MELDGVRRQVHSDTRWSEWAAAHRLSYREDAPDLVGVWFPAFDGMERYVHVIGGQWNGVGFWAFSRGTWNRPLGSDRGHTWIFHDFVFVKFPGSLAPEIVAMSPSEGFALLGGRLPTGFDFSYRGFDWLEGISPHMSPQLLEGVLENLALQINAAPASLWQH